MPGTTAGPAEFSANIKNLFARRFSSPLHVPSSKNRIEAHTQSTALRGQRLFLTLWEKVPGQHHLRMAITATRTAVTARALASQLPSPYTPSVLVSRPRSATRADSLAYGRRYESVRDTPCGLAGALDAGEEEECGFRDGRL